MIKLRVVGYSPDLQDLVLTSRKGDRKGSHVTPIDDRLFDVLERAWRARKAAERDERRATRATEIPEAPKLAPTDVQRLLRAGREPAQVAQLADAPLSWIERFYGPVLHERAGVIAECQKLWLEKPRLGLSGAPLGEAVTKNLRARRVTIDEDKLAEAWNATRQNGQPWVVTLVFSFRGRQQRAVWRYDAHTRTVMAGNRLAGDIGWVPNGRKAAARRATEDAGRARTATAGGKGKASKTSKPRPTPRAGKRATAKTAGVKRRPATKGRTPTKRRPAAKRRAPAKQRRPAAKRRAPAKRRPVTRRRAPAKRRPTAKRPVRKARRPATKTRVAARRTSAGRRVVRGSRAASRRR